MRGLFLATIILSVLISPAFCNELADNEILEFFAKNSQTNKIYETELLLIKDKIESNQKFYKIISEVINDSTKMGFNVKNTIGKRSTRSFFTASSKAMETPIITGIVYDTPIDKMNARKIPSMKTTNANNSSVTKQKIEKIKKIVAVIENTKKLNEEIVPYKFQDGADTWKFKP